VFPVLAFVFVSGLVVMRWVTGVSLLDAAQTVEEERRLLVTIEREVDRERVEVEQAIALARIEPRARDDGLGRVDVDAVMLLASREPARVPEARPLGVPGAGARGSWFQRVWGGARVAAAAAAVEERGEAGTEPGAKAAPRGPARHETNVARCDVCRARAAGRNASH
jgi:hypothetical protein